MCCKTLYNTRNESSSFLSFIFCFFFFFDCSCSCFVWSVSTSSIRFSFSFSFILFISFASIFLLLLRCESLGMILLSLASTKKYRLIFFLVFLSFFSFFYCRRKMSTRIVLRCNWFVLDLHYDFFFISSFQVIIEQS